jgi:hypothetical protein
MDDDRRQAQEHPLHGCTYFKAAAAAAAAAVVVVVVVAAAAAAFVRQRGRR